MHPEQKARQIIDKMLRTAGWILQDMKDINLGAASGIVVQEYPLESGEHADYIMFLNRNPVGVIEAKKESVILTQIEDQTEKYAKGQLKWLNEKEKPIFIYQSSGKNTRFTDLRDEKPRSRQLFHFHKPETFEEWLKNDQSLRNRLKLFESLSPKGLRECQFRAINNLEISFAESRPRALIQMATGSGKTYTAITSVYRLLKPPVKAKRTLFLVDTRNLGEQAEQEFQAYQPQDDKRKFTELYGVQRLSTNFIDKDAQVCISTIQRMYSILRGKEMDESAEETSLYEINQRNQKPKEVAYNEKYPPEFFDFIIVDECHRSIYNLWKQVLDYFDAFIIGLTATPDSRTFGFFNENVVSEYSHEEAVADGVNVGFDIYTIETKITKQGSKIEAKEYVDVRSRQSRQVRWEQLDEELVYSNKDLDKAVVNKSQIRQIIKTFRNKLKTEIFPNRKEVPKTLIFAKTDSHANDIIEIVREEFAEGNVFCKKVTYNVKDEKPSEILQQFRTAYYPRIAVTVDMIATGTDVKPLECLLFMRDVRSKNYFEQMKGRGTRTLRADDLKKVTPSAGTNKTHFVIVDAVGVCKSLKTDSRALERRKNVSLKDLMMQVAMGNRDEDTFTSLANRLTRMEKQISENEKDTFRKKADGKSINRVVKDLLDAYNPDKHEEKAKEKFNLKENENPTGEQLKQVKNELSFEAGKIFDSSGLRDYIENVRKGYDQVIDTVNIDILEEAGWKKDSLDRSEKLADDFNIFIEENKDKITALSIFYNFSYRSRELNFKVIKELRNTLVTSKPNLAPLDVWEAYKTLENRQIKNPISELTALVALVRRVVGLDKKLILFSDIVNLNFKEWVFEKNKGYEQFSEEKMEWLRMIRDHITSSIRIDKEDFDNTPFIEKGGLVKMWELFGEQLDVVIEELNKELIA